MRIDVPVKFTAKENPRPGNLSFLRCVDSCYTFTPVVLSFLRFLPLYHALYLYDNNPQEIKNTAADSVSKITGTIARISKILTALRVCSALSETEGRVCGTDTHKRAGKIRNRSVSRDCLRRLRRTSSFSYSINSICTSPKLSSVTILYGRRIYFPSESSNSSGRGFSVFME